MDAYGTDILEWSQHQAALLRRAAAGEPVHDLDWPNIIAEIESVGQSQVDVVESLLLRALVHMLKVEGWPQSREVERWRGEVRLFRAQARRKYRPSMRDKLEVPALYADALKAMPAIMDNRPPLPVKTACPTTLDELLAES